MTNSPEAAEQHPHATHHLAVQAQAPLGGGETGALHHYGDLVRGGGGGAAATRYSGTCSQLLGAAGGQQSGKDRVKG